MVMKITRYANRKLYYPMESRYTTLTELWKCYQNNVKIIITDNRTNEDITNQILVPAFALKAELTLEDLFSGNYGE